MEKEQLKMEIRNVDERFKWGGFGEDFMKLSPYLL
jgi:hypothetical protein